MKPTPLVKANPTNADIVENLNNLHECVDDGKRATNKELKIHTRRMKAIEEKVAGVESAVNTMSLKLGTKPGEEHPTLATMPQWRALVSVAGATGGGLAGIFLFWKIVVTLGPFLLAAFWALNHMIVGD